MSTATTFDLATFTRAIEERDASTQVAMYSENASVTLADRNAQPGSPRVLRGKGEIATWVEDVCARDMTHRVGHTVSDETGVAFTEACRYPDGTNVLCATVLEIEDGLITRQVGVQAWDE
ncbi:MAG TPA: nuclear transport factor 2 family protein [Solirubrobacteraceae bacterium]|nr:nuclear transport factor 2 family protein [Solirubrobacteraceae bacterium]